MYIGLKLVNQWPSLVHNNKVVQHFIVCDSEFVKDFFIDYYLTGDGFVDSPDLADLIIDGIYNVYKFSKKPICRNMARVFTITLKDKSVVSKTNFYKINGQLIEHAWKTIL